MSEVYIRSQKKEGLYVLSNASAVRYSTNNREELFFCLERDNEKPTGKHYIFLFNNNGTQQKLGEYESKERCIEILDEIQEKCSQYLYAAGSLGLLVGSEAMPPMAAVIPRVYQMPEK